MRLPKISAGPNCDCGAAKHYTREYMYVPSTEPGVSDFRKCCNLHVHTALQIMKIESRFITIIDVVYYLALLARLLTCTYSYTRSHTHIGLHQLTYNHTIAHSLIVTHTHTFTHNNHKDTQTHTHTHNIHIYSKIQIFITLIYMHIQMHAYNTIQSHARTHTLSNVYV